LSGAGRSAPEKRVKKMKPLFMAGIVLVVLGAMALIYQGFTYTREKPVLDIGPIHATADTKEHVSLPPIIGGLGVGVGLVLMAVGAKQKNS
jgi:hypothetical protein